MVEPGRYRSLYPIQQTATLSRARTQNIPHRRSKPFRADSDLCNVEKKLV